ncbi:MAG: hypothetical protein DMG12_02540 [Acidobacteria bacterium]|nr:MAG: hypothetical protein DMG12_02540 [Acidobacteriota bacterium]
MHDAVTVEKAGIAATAIITDGFVQTALAISRVSGMPEFPFAVIAHPIANNNETTLRTKAAEAARQCEAILLGR